jgi:hypothetical protein
LTEFQYAAAILPELLVNSRVVADRSKILHELPKGITFVELGVALGDFTESVLEICEVDKFIAVDLFGLHGAPQMWGGRVGQTLAGRTHSQYFEERFKDEIAAGKLVVMRGKSVECLRQLADRSVDVFYVDSEHSYETVRAELALIKHKIRDGGYIILNDYIMVDYVTNTPYGVVKAVNEFMNTEKWELLFFALHNAMFCDVAIRKVRQA